ncbi:MAG: hypothetical protein IJC97_02715 [Oscillospiraceae bacterium]|nr:hypothetical protein [Oscillospiraceae bacterium]
MAIYNGQASMLKGGAVQTGSLVGISKMANGLKASRLGIMAASENRVNSETEGYARRDVALYSNELRCVLADLCRISNDYAQNDLRAMNSSAEYYKTVSDSFSLLEQYIAAKNSGQLADDPNAAIDASDIGGALKTLRLSLDNLSTDKDDIAKKQNVRDAVHTLIETIKRTYGMVQQTEEKLTQSLPTQVERINNLLEEINNLSLEISAASAGGRAVFSLEDARDKKLKELSNYIPIEVENLTEEVNGCQMQICRVSLKANETQIADPAGNHVLNAEERKLIDGRGRVDVAKFDIEQDQNGNDVLTFYHAGTRNAAGVAQGRAIVGDTNNGVVPLANHGYDFQNYLQTAFKDAGSLAATLNALKNLNNGAPAAGRADERIHNISDFKGFLDTLANNLTTELNNANAGNALLAGANVAALAIAPAWLANANQLQSAQVDALCAKLDERLNNLNVIDGADHNFEEFFDAIVVNLGKDINQMNTRLEVAQQRLDAAKDRVEKESGVNAQEDVIDIQTFRAIYQFVQNALQVRFQLLDLSANLLKY